MIEIAPRPVAAAPFRPRHLARQALAELALLRAYLYFYCAAGDAGLILDLVEGCVKNLYLRLPATLEVPMNAQIHPVQPRTLDETDLAALRSQIEDLESKAAELHGRIAGAIGVLDPQAALIVEFMVSDCGELRRRLDHLSDARSQLEQRR